MNPVTAARTTLWWLVMLAGLLGSVATGYRIVSGPFFGGPLLDPVPLMVSSGIFLIGMIVFAVGGSKLVNVYSG